MIKERIRSSILYKPLSYIRADFNEFPMRFAAFFFRKLPIKKGKIVIENANLREPKILTDALIQNDSGYDIVWIVSQNYKYPKEVRVVRPKSLQYVYELSTAGIWIDNSRKEYWVKKRKGQLYIQTWHSPVCIKKVENDAINGLSPSYIRAAKRDSRNINYFVAESKWREKNIYDAFWYKGPIIRGEFKDFLLDVNINREKILKDLAIQNIDHIILYVPTFRRFENMDCYNIDYEMLLASLSQKYGGNWCVIVRLHPSIANKDSFMMYSQKIINGTAYQPLSDLINIADFIITDYSGCLFHGYRAQKPVFIYASDIDTYLNSERGSYFNFDQLPSPVARTNSELLTNILNFDKKKYEEERKTFINNIGYFESDAAQQIVEIIYKYVGY